MPSLSREPAERRPAGNVNNVLDSDRDAVQRAAAVAGCNSASRLGRLTSRALGVDQHPGLYAIFELIDPGEASIDELRARKCGT